jgi:hypothetical protein
MRIRYFVATVAALIAIAPASAALAADSTSAAQAVVASGTSAVKAYRHSAVSLAAAPARRCATIACPGYVIVGLAF